MRGRTSRATNRIVRRGMAARCGLVVLGALLGACAAPRSTSESAERGARVHVAPRDVPDARASDPARARAELEAARQAAGRGRTGAAVGILTALIEREPRYVPAHRLLQDLLVDSPADWTLRQRYALRGASAAADHSADELYLAARIEPDRERQAELFDAALERDPGHPWARVGRALGRLREGDLLRAELEALRAADIAPDLAMPWIFLGSLYLAQADAASAVAAYAEAVRRDPSDPRGHLGMSAAAREAGDPAAAASAALEALRRAPGDPMVLSIAGRALVEGGVPASLREALRVLTAARPRVRHVAWLEATRARLLLAAGDAAAARLACDRALDAGVGPGRLARVRRRACVLSGAYADAVEGYLARAPGALLDDDNRYAARWRSLSRAAHDAESDDRPARLLTLAEACFAVGWRREGAVLLARVQAGSSSALRRRAARRAAEERAFDRLIGDVAAMSRGLRRAALRGEDVADVDDVLRAIGTASTRRIGRDVASGATVRSYPFLGEFAVSIGSDGPFARELDARGLLLLVGKRRGDGPRIVMGRLAVVRSDATARIAGHALEFDECWLETDGLPPSLAGLGGGLAGLTMDRLVILQLDTVLRGPPPVADVELVPRPAPGRVGRLALDTPSSVAVRIEADLARQIDLAAAALDTVRTHELGHVLDAHLMLPVFAPPWRAVGLALRHGLDGASVEAHLEARAAVVALAEARVPRAALASLLGFLPETDGSTAHVRGYVDVVRRMVAEIEADPTAFPSILPGLNILQQMDRLGDDEARELGRRILRGM